MGKPCRNALISQRKCICPRAITYTDLLELQSVSKGTNDMDPRSLLNPMDKLNVPNATELMLRVICLTPSSSRLEITRFNLSRCVGSLCIYITWCGWYFGSCFKLLLTFCSSSFILILFVVPTTLEVWTASIVNRSQWIHAVSDVLINHPYWKTKHYRPKCLSVTLDQSNIAQWSSNDLNLRNRGNRLHNALIHLLKSGLLSASEMNFIEA